MRYRYISNIIFIVLGLTVIFTYQDQPGPQNESKAETLQIKVADLKIMQMSFKETPEPEPEAEYLGEFTATAYCPCRRCCGKSDAITASGERVKEGVTVAADWRVIPKGTKVIIEGMGERTVQDKGGAIKGRRIDIYFNEHQRAKEFGRQKLKIWVLRE